MVSERAFGNRSEQDDVRYTDVHQLRGTTAVGRFVPQQMQRRPVMAGHMADEITVPFPPVLRVRTKRGAHDYACADGDAGDARAALLDAHDAESMP